MRPERGAHLRITGDHGFTRRPVLLSETAVGPRAGQAGKIRDLFRGVTASGVLGLVWFDFAQHAGVYHQDWRLETSPAGMRAFRRAASAELMP